jgi:hypothetical protein
MTTEDRLAEKILLQAGEIARLRAALKVFADETAWDILEGYYTWVERQCPTDFAKSALDGIL